MVDTAVVVVVVVVWAECTKHCLKAERLQGKGRSDVGRPFFVQNPKPNWTAGPCVPFAWLVNGPRISV